MEFINRGSVGTICLTSGVPMLHFQIQPFPKMLFIVKLQSSADHHCVKTKTQCFLPQNVITKEHTHTHTLQDFTVVMSKYIFRKRPKYTRR